MNTTKHIEELPLVLSIEDLCRILNIGKNTAYDLIHSGQIKHLRVGRQIRISKSAFWDYLNALK